MREKGVSEVKLFIIKETSGDKQAKYFVQVGAFEKRQNAVKLKEKILKHTKNVHIVERAGKFKVLIGPFNEEKDARAVLTEIKKKTKIPLVLHGASSVPQQLIKTADKFGAKIANAHGLPDSQLKAAIKNGINKVNTDTDLRLAFNAAVRRFLMQNPGDFDPRHVLGEAKKLVQKVVEHRIAVCGSINKISK